jgi:hypothetical protein
VQAALDADVASMQFELMNPGDPSSFDHQPNKLTSKNPPVVILGFNEASQVLPCPLDHVRLPLFPL